MLKRVVVTGIGMINCVGLDAKSSFKAIVNGECGIKRITLFDASNHSVSIAGEIEGFDPATVMDGKEV
ncbi:MAG: beta-ketoacyl-ACP synthase II, partial [Campylobacteraceae bacterium]|nr:beta-ketoacyl-ACP synthase II [Campylobacteraceae bacterium]